MFLAQVVTPILVGDGQNQSVLVFCCLSSDLNRCWCQSLSHWHRQALIRAEWRLKWGRSPPAGGSPVIWYVLPQPLLHCSFVPPPLPPSCSSSAHNTFRQISFLSIQSGLVCVLFGNFTQVVHSKACISPIHNAVSNWGSNLHNILISINLCQV